MAIKQMTPWPQSLLKGNPAALSASLVVVSQVGRVLTKTTIAKMKMERTFK